MGRKKKPCNVRQRSYVLLLYPDNKEHMRVFRWIKRDIKGQDRFIGLWHRQFDKNGAEVFQGDIKKHLHIVIHFRNERRWHAVADSFGLDWDDSNGPRFLRPIGYDDKHDLNWWLVYLTHRNTPEKTQYSVSDLFGSSSLICKAQDLILAEESKYSSILDFWRDLRSWLAHMDCFVTPNHFVQFLQNNPYLKYQNNAIAWKMINYHNYCITHPYGDNEVDYGSIVQTDDALIYGVEVPF